MMDIAAAITSLSKDFHYNKDQKSLPPAPPQGKGEKG